MGAPGPILDGRGRSRNRRRAEGGPAHSCGGDGYSILTYRAHNALVPKFHLGTSPVPRKIPFRADLPSTQMGSAMKWPPQVRSQVKLGNEGFNEGFVLPHPALLRQGRIDRLPDRVEIIADVRRVGRVKLLPDGLAGVVGDGGAGAWGIARQLAAVPRLRIARRGIGPIRDLGQKRLLRGRDELAIPHRIDSHAQGPRMPGIFLRLPLADGQGQGVGRVIVPDTLPLARGKIKEMGGASAPGHGIRVIMHIITGDPPSGGSISGCNGTQGCIGGESRTVEGRRTPNGRIRRDIGIMGCFARHEAADAGKGGHE